MLNSSSSAVEVAFPALLVALDHFQHGADVLFDIEAAENRGFLRQIADAEAGALVHRQRRDVVAVELDASFVGLDQAGHHVEHRRLAGAVGAEQAHCFAAADREADALHDLAADEALLDTMDGQKALAVDRLDRCRRGGAAAPAGSAAPVAAAARGRAAAAEPGAVATYRAPGPRVPAR